MNTEVEKRYRELTQEIEARFAELCQELGTELASSKANAGEIREMLASFEGQKETMAANIVALF